MSARKNNDLLIDEEFDNSGLVMNDLALVPLQEDQEPSEVDPCDPIVVRQDVQQTTFLTCSLCSPSQCQDIASIDQHMQLGKCQRCQKPISSDMVAEIFPGHA